MLYALMEFSSTRIVVLLVLEYGLEFVYIIGLDNLINNLTFEGKRVESGAVGGDGYWLCLYCMCMCVHIRISSCVFLGVLALWSCLLSVCEQPQTQDKKAGTVVSAHAHT